jgi:hypothetical protein
MNRLQPLFLLGGRVLEQPLRGNIEKTAIAGQVVSLPEGLNSLNQTKVEVFGNLDFPRMVWMM